MAGILEFIPVAQTSAAVLHPQGLKERKCLPRQGKKCLSPKKAAFYYYYYVFIEVIKDNKRFFAPGFLGLGLLGAPRARQHEKSPEVFRAAWGGLGELGGGVGR